MTEVSSIQTSQNSSQPAANSNTPAAAAQSQPLVPPPASPSTGEVNGRPLAFYEQTFFSLNNSLHRTEFQFGVLQMNNEIGRLLISGFLLQQRGSNPDNFWKISHQHLDFAFEPQAQFHLGNGWELYFRTPFTFHTAYAETPSSTDFLADLTVGHNWSDQLFRLEYGVNGIGTDGEPSHYLTATPYFRFHLYKDWIMLRLGAKYACSFGSPAAHVLTLEGKLEGTIRPDPWSGWGIQVFAPIVLNPELREGQRRMDLAGFYLWAGSVLPRSWLGAGWFVEGGIWIGGHIDESNRPGQDLAAGINLKIKYGTEARWWQ